MSETQKKYNTTEKRRRTQRKSNKKYRQTEHGKLACRKGDLKKKFGITLEQYDKMFEQQNGVCAICDQVDITGRRLAVDHDHETGKVRGLLCTGCNTRLGILENKTWRLLAERYLLSSLTSK